MIARARATLQSVPAWRWALYLDAAIGGIYTVLIGGTVLTGVILWAGGGAWQLGLLSALTTGGGLLVVATRRLQHRLRSHQDLTRAAWTAARVAWVPLALLLALIALEPGVDREILLPVVLATSFVAAALAGIGNVAWYSWVAELVAPTGRGAFLASRAQALSVATLVALPIVGFVLDRGHAYQQDALGFAGVVLATLFCGLIGWRALSAVPSRVAVEAEPASAATTRRHRGESISATRFALFTVVFQAGVYLSAPFFQAYSLQRLGMSLGLLMNLQVVAQIIPILTLGFWGKLSDRIGLRLPLGLCSVGKAVVPLCYLVASPSAWWPVLFVYLLSVLDAGIMVTNGAAFAEIAAGSQGSAKVVHLNVLTSLAASITPLLAGYLVGNLNLPGVDVLALAFVLSAIGRGLSGVILLIPERPRRLRRLRPGLPRVGRTVLPG